MKVLNGEEIAKSILNKVKAEIQDAKLYPRLDIIYIGDNFASNVYVDKKKKQGESVGIEVVLHKYEKINLEEVSELIDTLNNDPLVHGIMIQIPFKVEGATSKEVLQLISPEKDVDGLSALSLGAVWQNIGIGYPPATALATLECLKHMAVYEDGQFTVDELNEHDIEQKLSNFLEGKNILVINHSNIVGKPIAGLLLNYNATVSIAHKFTKNLKTLTQNADIVISGTGIPGFITKDMVKKGSILIDIGINETANGVGGDINHEGMDNYASWITPVPGGVGPITVAMLLRNTLLSSSLT